MQTRNRGNREAASVAGAEWASGRVADEDREQQMRPESRPCLVSHKTETGAVLIAT